MAPLSGRVIAFVRVLALTLMIGGTASAQKPAIETATEFGKTVQPLLKKYCLGCHSTKLKKGSLDLERFASIDVVRKDLKPWLQVIEQLGADEMPPKKNPQPTTAERQYLIKWARAFLDGEARARAGDPGHVPLRRLSNTEYDSTIRDLAGVDLRPTREFPADGAAGEGFTNAAEALSDVSPTLLNKYLNAARDIAEHAVLLPDGFRFSPTKTRRDWTDESTGRLRSFFAKHAGGDGRLQFQRYLEATVRNRTALLAGTLTLDEVAAKQNLNRKYLGILWKTLTDKTSLYPLDAIGNRWRTATDAELPALLGEITALQAALWNTARVGSYIRRSANGTYLVNPARQFAVDPPAVNSVPLRIKVAPVAGQAEIVLYLATRELTPAKGKQVVWHRPRFEAAGKPPLLLSEYAKFGQAFEINLSSVFVGSTDYLAAAVEAANDRTLPIEQLAKKRSLDAAFLKRWVEVLDVQPLKKDAARKTIPAVAIKLLEDQTPKKAPQSINGWRKKGTDLPVLITNSSDKTEKVPGRVSAHGVSVHPLPKEFVAVTWKSPLKGKVGVEFRIAHAHPTCGNGVAWWCEHRRGGRATVLGEGVVDLGKQTKQPARTVPVEQGDTIVLAVDARDSNHFCDLTEIELTITADDDSKRVWDLAKDIADTVLAGNPHADGYGNRDTWGFGFGVSKGSSGRPADQLIPANSILGQWRGAAADPARTGDVTKLAKLVEALLSGPRPKNEKTDDRILYDRLLAIDGPLLKGVDVAKLAKAPVKRRSYGLPSDRFGTRQGGKPVDDASLVAAVNSVTEVRLPAALLFGREFVVDGRLDGDPGDRVVQFQVQTTELQPNSWLGTGQLLASPESAGFKRLIQGYTEFRRVFPLFLCYPQVIPNDEVVSLKMFHREDEPLARLFLDDEQQQRLNHLWDEHRFISKQPIDEMKYLPLFIGFVTQDQPKSMFEFFEGQRPAFQKRADDLLAAEQVAIPKQLDALLEFAGRAYRRPLSEKETTDLRALYKTIRAKGHDHDDTVRRVLTRILVAPAFLFRIEQSPAGTKRQPINDWELATRLSYFLWASAPDEELRKLAAAGQLRNSDVLAGQVERMLEDQRLRALAIEFGTQWLHVRGFDQFSEKNETLFPTFDADFRAAAYEESVLFFQNLFQSDGAVTEVLDADYTFLNERLAKHYGIPGVSGPQWRRVDGVRKYGRGGVLGLASVQAKQAGASRSSPVLRGNWVVETLLGEKLPRPPAEVPRLPEKEGSGGLTMRQQVELHAKSPSCAKCHVRIDPYGFALEGYDSIGRLRKKDLAGLDVDAKAKLRDGTEFEGIDGLRAYLLTKKKDVVVRLFCRRLLGYALGRAVTLSDTSLIDEMVSELNKNDNRVSSAVQTIVRSSQFRMIRGSGYSE